MAVGNILNADHPKKSQADGFKEFVKVIEKIGTFKGTAKNSKSLLQFVCEVLYEEDNDLIKDLEEVACVSSNAKTRKSDQLATVVKEMDETFKTSKTKFDHVNKTCHLGRVKWG